MNTIKFHSGQSFEEVRKLITNLNRTENRNMIAHLTWRDGTAKDQTVVYLYDAMAERFGHTVDKESIGVEIVSSLMNGIPVEISVSPKKA